MLVCNVSLLRRRAAIAADIAETTTALDAPGSGNVVFAALVDDPASVREFVDAFLGQIMREAANATATVNAGLTYATTIVETASAGAAVDAPFYRVAVTESAAAADAPSASVTSPAVYTAAIVEAASAVDLVSYAAAGSRFEGALALDGPLMPANPAPTVIYIDGIS
jgi:hypothetical protein